MTWKYHYEATCCGHERIHEDDPLVVGDDYRDVCPDCGWLTTWSERESYVVDEWGHVL